MTKPHLKYRNRYEIVIYRGTGESRLHLSRRSYGWINRFSRDDDAFSALARLLMPDDVGFTITWFWGGREIVETGYVPLELNPAHDIVKAEIEEIQEKRRAEREARRGKD